MFTIFPSMSILDTLDKSGKDAYTSSSMALTVSRVPDTLFDKSPPAPVIPPVTFPVAPSRPSAVTSTVPAARTSSVSKAVTPLVATSSRKSIKVDSKDKKIDKPDKSAKSGKSAKLGKTALATKSRSASARAGLIFPVGRLKRKLKESMPSMRVSKGTSVYLSAVLEYLSA